MVLILINILVTILSPIEQFVDHVSKDYVVETKTTKMIDLSQDSIMKKILYDELSKEILNGSDGFIIVRYGQFKSGVILKISKYPYDILKSSIGFIGYSIVNGKKVLFEGDNSYKFNFVHPTQTTKINRYVKNTSNGDDEFLLSYYYILDDIYAKYSEGNGWIWSDGKPDE